MSCPSCGAVSDPGARFCSSCGGPLAEITDERRVVTVLFADIVGYTTMAEPLDPELVKNLVDRSFQRLVIDITDFGGQVDKIVGDAIVALFGAPVAHEDDAERAVRAALRMQQTLEQMAAETGAAGADAIRMRIGVNTGEVLVGALRAGGSITAMGDVVNTASRLQTSAKPGEVIVGSATHAATRGVILYESRGLLQAKGREERVRCWAAVETLLPPGYRPTRRTVPLVGRNDEMALLTSMVDSSVANRRALLTLLVGDAGLGKTRLATEMAAWATEAHGALTIEGRCVPYGEANVWWPVAEALRHACFIDASAPLEEANARVTDRVSQVLDAPVGAAEVQRVTGGLLHMLGYPNALREPDPSTARDEAVHAVVMFIEASTRHQPVVIQLSDLHWADEVVLDLADVLLERLARQPFVLVGTARQAIRERWTPKPGRHNFLSVNLDPLEDDAAGELLGSLAESSPSPELRDALVARSGGNPFFLEELVALVAERSGSPVGASAAGAVGAGADGLTELPDTLRGLVAARLDGLTADERSVLTDAAVLGRRGAVEHLRRLSIGMGRNIDVDAAVAELVAKELFELSDGQWSFRSDLVREVAYSTITKSDRAKRHVGIASWIEEHYRDVWTDGAIDRMANHYGQAASMIGDLGGSIEVPEQVRERAVFWIGRAAERAVANDLMPVAERLYSQALDLLPEQASDARLDLLLGRGRARAESWSLDAAAADARHAIDDGTELGDATRQARGTLLLGDIAHRHGDIDEAVRVLRDAAAQFEALGDDQGRGEALRLEGMAHLFRGAIGEAEVAVHAALDVFRKTGSSRGEAWALQNLAWIAFTTGRTAEAEERLHRSIATFTELGDETGIAWATGLLAFVKFQQGEHDEARALGGVILDEARARGDRWATGMMLVLMSSLDLWAGRTPEAVAEAGDAVAAFAELGDPYGTTQASAPLARSLIMVGRVEEGLAAFDNALAAASSSPGEAAVLLARGAIAVAHTQLGDPLAALGSVDFGDDGSKPSLLVVGNELWAVLALIRLQQGRTAEAVAVLAELPDGEARDRPFTHGVMALVAAADGRVAEAIAQADLVPTLAAATYLDQATAELGAGLALAGAGDAAGREWCDRAVARVDATGDLLDQAVIRLGRAVALCTLESEDAADAMTEARSRLGAMDVCADGWTTAFTLAAGAGADASTLA